MDLRQQGNFLEPLLFHQSLHKRPEKFTCHRRFVVSCGAVNSSFCTRGKDRAHGLGITAHICEAASYCERNSPCAYQDGLDQVTFRWLLWISCLLQRCPLGAKEFMRGVFTLPGSSSTMVLPRQVHCEQRCHGSCRVRKILDPCTLRSIEIPF